MTRNKADHMYWVHPDSIYPYHSFCQEGDTLCDDWAMTYAKDGKTAEEKVKQKAWHTHRDLCRVCGYKKSVV